MERIGIYGGAFNPPHIGHVRAAQYVAQHLDFSRLLLIPSNASPHKKLPEGSPTAQQRFEMLSLAVKQDARLEVSDIELRRGGTSYTYETVAALREKYPEAELVLCMGTDMFLSFLSWRKPEEILKNVSIAVFYRGQKEEAAAVLQQKVKLESSGARVYLVENPITQISSTDLRRMLAFNCAGAFLPEGVADYIRENRLYAGARNYKGLSEKQLEEAVTGLLKENRVAHVLGCRDAAVSLARHWGADETDAARAALLHDVTKALDGPLQLTLCGEYGIVLDDFSVQNPKTLHALTGSLVAQRIFGENPAVVAAIRSHTTGKADMNLLEKIIYVADYMEPNRDFPGVDQLRQLAYSNIDSALKRGLEMTLAMLKEQGRAISPGSQEALVWLQQNQ